MAKSARTACLILLLFAAAVSCRGPADGPVAFGRRAVDEALAARNLEAPVSIDATGTGLPESFEIAFEDGRADVRGADPNGALYGALELAERIRRFGADALRGAPVGGKPFLRDRGWNLFLTLPWDYAADDTDYDPAALADPDRWWFANDGYWRTLFDEMARARLNWLDIHGTWDISVTDAPNLYAYFIQSDRFPKVGVASEIKDANLKQLNKIIAMAHDRGVRVSLMAYEARFHTPHAPDPYPENEKDLYDYTREMVETMIRRVPGLDAIGFRIGESGHGEGFFNCYLEAVKASGRDIPLITRSWLARKPRVVPLAAASRDFTVEIKYNGEQWGSPYMLMGGRMAGWYSYSFEDYLSDSSAAGAVRLWPGNPAPGGGEWPAEPYKLVWQVRANGTHRILPVHNPGAVRRAVKSMPLGTASGFTVECLETYYPKSPRYYVADPGDLYCDWTHERDRLFLRTWGRLGYDPETPDDVFEAMAAETFGATGAPLFESWAAAGRIIHTAFSGFSLGPDHRNHAIELEWGGDTAGYLAGDPFDSHVFKSAREALADAATGGLDGRIAPPEAAARLVADAETAAKAADIPLSLVPAGERKRFGELVVVCGQAAHLGRYYAERFMSAYRAGQAEAGTPGAAGQAAAHMREAEQAWSALAAQPFYKPFTERLRMRTNAFHWSQELPKIKAEADRLARLAAPVPEPIAPYAAPDALPALSVDAGDKRVRLSLPAAGISRAWALVKPLPSSAFFHKFAMTRAGEKLEYVFAREPWGHALAAEVERDGRVTRIPGWDADAPYLIVASLPGPTPLIYSSEQALTFLDPGVLDPAEHGLLLVSSRASNFHRFFGVPVVRKVLDPIRRGLTLVVLAQDYLGGRYTTEWLPRPLAVAAARPGVFEPSGFLGMLRIADADILRQAFLPSPGWTIAADGGAAVLPWGKGRIVMINARLVERLHLPACARSLAAVLGSREPGKPVVIVDAGTEGGQYSTSVMADFMNARGIPFLTLGEVIARKQGVGATTAVPGPVDDDTLLAAVDIRGPQMANAFLEAKAKTAAALPAPATRDAFERRREVQRRELFRSLGLDPLPPRTPLNARVAGVIERPGYRIEKVVFESRPDFPVTAHLYVPAAPAGAKLPVIVNPHGHWEWKKQEPTVQARLIGQALHGYLALVVDSPGYSFEGDNRVERRWAGTHDDLRLVLGSQNATSVYVWDLVRALDYLETRPEADMSRVGLTGASGGGLATLWAFAVEPRFRCAAPVVYASSYEVNPNNGCLCNHVPGSLRIGDRADVLGLRAPDPVLIIGAEDDGEFPAKGMRLTGEKLRMLWGLYGKADDAWLRMFPGGHDYGRPMREAVLGFFDKYLRGAGDGSPVPEPAFETAPPDAPEMYVLPEPPARTLTMRGIARAMFEEGSAGAEARIAGTAADYIALNGGLPAVVPAAVREIDAAGGKRRAVFVSEEGLTLPVLIWHPEGETKAVVLLASDRGKSAATEEFPVERLRRAGILVIAIDPRGLGETRGLNLRFQTYLGQSPAFGMGWDITRAIAAFAPDGLPVAVVGRGPAAGQAALVAALLEPRVGFVAGLETLREFQDAFRDDVPLIAVQPRANDAPSLLRLRALVEAESVWSFLDEPEPDWAGALVRRAEGPPSDRP
jgi:dienelactone hydrolase